MEWLHQRATDILPHTHKHMVGIKSWGGYNQILNFVATHENACKIASEIEETPDKYTSFERQQTVLIKQHTDSTKGIDVLRTRFLNAQTGFGHLRFDLSKQHHSKHLRGMLC